MLESVITIRRSQNAKRSDLPLLAIECALVAMESTLDAIRPIIYRIVVLELKGWM